MPQWHTWQPLSMCRQRGQPENSLHHERTHAEGFLILKGFFPDGVNFLVNP